MSKRKNTATAKQVAKINEPKPLPAAIRTGLWAVWGYGELKDGMKKPPKIPAAVGDFGRVTWIGTSDESQWTDHETAQAALARAVSKETGAYQWTKQGLGRLCGSEPELTMLDLDDCINAKGALDPTAAELVKRAATYTEVSPSGKGLRLVLTGGKPEGLRHAEVGVVGGFRVECYDAASTRYVTLTGAVLPGTKPKVAPWSKGFAKWFAENWQRTPGKASRGGLTIVPEAVLAELVLAEATAGTPGHDYTVRTIDWTRHSTLDANNKLKEDRSSAFAHAFLAEYRIAEQSAGAALQCALHAIGDDMTDKGNRRVVVEETGEIIKVPFPVADAARLKAHYDEQCDVKRKMHDLLKKVPAKDRPAMVKKFVVEFPEHTWHVALVALQEGVRPSEVGALVGEDVVISVTNFLARVRSRAA